MNSINNRMTALAPSAFGMPTCGHAFETMTDHSAPSTGTTVVRDRQVNLVGFVGVAKAGLGITLAYSPGTSAWRPPIC